MPQCTHGWGFSGLPGEKNNCPQCNGAVTVQVATMPLPIQHPKPPPIPIVERAREVSAGKSRSYVWDARMMAQWIVDNADYAEAATNYDHAVANLTAVQTRCSALYTALRDLWRSAVGETVRFSDFKSAVERARDALFAPDEYSKQLGLVYDCPHCRVKNSTAHPAIWCHVCSQFCTPSAAPR